MISVQVDKNLFGFSIHAAFQAPAKGVTAFFGPSGAGKTSIINMVAGLVRPDQGCIKINRHCLFDARSGTNLPPEQRRIGYVFQDGRLFPHLSVRTNLTYGMQRVPIDQRHVSLDQVLALLGIKHLIDRKPATLSGGEKQRVAIGRALLTSPELLLMDEPLAALDSSRKAEVLPFIARLADQFAVPIFYVSHAWDEIVDLADTLVLVEEGRVVAAGALETLMTNLAARKLTRIVDSGALLNTVVDCHQEAITLLRFDGGSLAVPRGNWSLGHRLRVHIQARHVAVARTRPSGTSIQNILPAVVESVTPKDGCLVDVGLNIGCPLVARITSKALQDLGLKRGQQVFALIKSVGISVAGSYRQPDNP
jgi:molybdate transport system ATP-binding protein